MPILVLEKVKRRIFTGCHRSQNDFQRNHFWNIKYCMRVVIFLFSRRIAIVHIEGVMYISNYRQYPAYYMPLILCYWKILHNTWYSVSINIDIIKLNNVPVCFVADEVLSDWTQQHSTGANNYQIWFPGDPIFRLWNWNMDFHKFVIAGELIRYSWSYQKIEFIFTLMANFCSSKNIIKL